ncbi:MAG: tetratricopeptide repeat-containing sulfotransferase family protein [Bacillota bacterium]
MATNERAPGGTKNGIQNKPNPVTGSQNMIWGLPGAGNYALTITPAVPLVSPNPTVSTAPPLDLQACAQREANLGDSLYGQSRFAEALPRYAEAVRMQPHHAGYHFRLAMAAWQARHLELVESHLQEAVRLSPANPQAHEAISQWYYEAANLPLALSHSARAVELAPRDPEIAISRAIVLEGNSQPDAAWRVISPLLTSGFLASRLGVVYGRIAPSLKRERDALTFLDRLIASPQITPGEKAALHFTAANLLDRLGQYDQAFEHARLANQACAYPYDPKSCSDWIDRHINYFTPARLYNLPRASHQNRRPVFIVGMLRSGTSLVEQILASHPQVYGAGELNTLSRIAIPLNNPDWTGGDFYPEYVDAISLRRANKLANAYLSAIASLNSTATYVTDKMPHNFLYLGLIAILFPDCHVIHCTRNPLDTCLSCYMTHFANGHDYTHDLAHLGAFYRDYQRLMTHWKQVLNFPMLEVRYEDVVSDLQGQTRRMLEFLELPWDERCLSFHKNKRPVSTASREQVRRPIYASSVARWKRYEPHLAPLIASLNHSPSSQLTIDNHQLSIKR